MVQRQFMSPQRYCELREAGPTITAEDHKRLAGFQPKRNLTALLTRLALMLLWSERAGQIHAERARAAVAKRHGMDQADLTPAA